MSTSCSRKPDRSKDESCQATDLGAAAFWLPPFSFADTAWRSLRGPRACGNGGGLGSTHLVNGVFDCRPVRRPRAGAPFHVNRMGIRETRMGLVTLMFASLCRRD